MQCAIKNSHLTLNYIILIAFPPTRYQKAEAMLASQYTSLFCCVISICLMWLLSILYGSLIYF